MQIFGPFRVSTAAPIGGPQRSQPRSTPESNSAPQAAGPIDKLDISNHVNRVEVSPAGGGEIRVDRVAELRRQIASGTYETPEKLDIALSRFLDDFA